MKRYPFMSKTATVVDFGLTKAQEERAAALHKKAVVYDTLMECSWYEGMVGLMHKGGLTAGSLSIGTAGLENWQGNTESVTPRRTDWWTMDSLVKDVAYINSKARKHSDQMMMCYNAADIRKAKSLGKVGFMLDVQNTNFLSGLVENLDIAKGLGISRVQLTYNLQNAAGIGCMEKFEGGLSQFGNDVITRMNELNMLVDTGHCKSATVIAAAKASKKPIACSHAGIASRVNNPRTQTDAAMRAVADTGGVMGIVSTPGAINGTANCTAADYVNEIDAAVKIMGIDHVAFGTDLVMAASIQEILTAPEWKAEAAAAVGVNGDLTWPWSDGHIGMENNSGYPNLTRGLVAKGYTDEEILKLMGGNFVRLIEDTIG